ncbi:DUF308 domain-containing protein [Microbacterium halophytorum]|uniref:DUF308 domain-containing protein n=1 Tax=Microbacterium halophytorum TaxID=2067568 RepID=UPI000CFC0EDD|nr:DUF308 domain-containing protein [Microbacterium halophytorum]
MSFDNTGQTPPPNGPVPPGGGAPIPPGGAPQGGPTPGGYAPPPNHPGAPVPPHGGLPPQQPKEKNTVGLISLILGVVGFVFAFIPGALIVAWILLPAAFILGIIALCLKGKSKWMGLTGLILGIVGPIVAGIVFTTLVVGAFDEAFDEASGGETTVTEAPAEDEGAADDAEDAAPDDSADDASGEQGTRENPVSFDATIENDDWTVTLADFVPNANDDVAANGINDAPGDGEVWIEFTPTVTYHGEESGYAAEVQFAYVGADGSVSDSLTNIVILDDGFDASAELYDGGSATGKVALLVPDDLDGLIRVTPGFLGDDVFVSLP